MLVSFFMHAVSYQRKVALKTIGCLSLKVVSGQLCASGQIEFQESLVINISGKNQFIHLSVHCHFAFLFYLFIGIIYQTLQRSI